METDEFPLFLLFNAPGERESMAARRCFGLVVQHELDRVVG
jgi:hypothetical protein